MILSSPFFENNGRIPQEFTCDGRDLSPGLEFSDIPESAISLALIVHDPDAPNGNWVHWLLWNIAPQTVEIEEGTVPSETIQGTTSSGTRGYHGPCPPSGRHHYIFDLYALNTTLDLPLTTTDSELKTAIAGHILTQASLTGLYSRT